MMAADKPRMVDIPPETSAALMELGGLTAMARRGLYDEIAARLELMTADDLAALLLLAVTGIAGNSAFGTQFGSATS